MKTSEQPRLAFAPKWVPAMALLFALVAGVFAWQQRQGAQELTIQIASLAAQVREKNAAIQEGAAAIDRLRQENENYIKESASLREKGTAHASAAPKTGPAPSLSAADKSKVEFAAKTLDDPRGREIIRQKQSAVFKQIYGDFVKENNLSAEQAGQFFRLLLDEDMRQLDEGTNFFSGNGINSREADAKEWATRKAELDNQLKAVLGGPGLAKWEAYEKTTVERQILIHMREQLAINSTPLQADQADILLGILMEERARAPSAFFEPGAREDPRERYRKLLEGNNSDRYHSEEQSFHQRVLGRTGTLLDADQLEALENFQSQYIEVSKAGIEMLRDTMASRKN